MFYLKAETMLLILRLCVFVVAAPFLILMDLAAIALDIIRAKFNCKKVNITFLAIIVLIISLEMAETLLSTESEMLLEVIKLSVKTIFVYSTFIKTSLALGLSFGCFVKADLLLNNNKKAEILTIKRTINPMVNIKCCLQQVIIFSKSIQQKNHDPLGRDFFFFRF